MRKYLVLLLAVVSISVYSQKDLDSTGINMYNRGLECYNRGQIDSTIIIWTEIVEKKIAVKYDTYGVAFFNIPTLYWKLKNYEKAKEWYKKVIESDLHDYQSTGDLMEPHSNYKHKSAIALAGLYQIDENYEEVLYWLNQADTTYRYWGFEGSLTNVSIEQGYILDWKVKVLKKLNRNEEAIKQIITDLIYAGNRNVYFEKPETELSKLIDSGRFKKDLDVALSQIQIVAKDSNNWIAKFTLQNQIYEIHISKDEPIKEPHFWKTIYVNRDVVVDSQYIIGYIKQFDFYNNLK